MKAETLNESAAAELPAKRRSMLRLLLWAAAILAAVFLVAGIIAPHINAQRFSNPIRRALENRLGRNVEFQAVHFTLFSGPGFSLKNVLIQEDPRYGPEPFAYVPNLDARISWSKLLLGKIRFSSVRLDQPELNFAKRADGSWNVLDLMRHLGESNSGGINFFPAFEVSGGRIDFRFGKRKTTFYMDDCDFSVSPQRSGNVSVEFAGWPARTDRAGIGFGHLRGTVNWYAQPRRNGDRLDADLVLDPSNLGELTTLFEGHDIGVHGTISSRARIAGPLADLRISGDLHVDDIHRWDLFETSGEAWSVRYLGSLDLDAHRIELKTAPEPGAKPASVQLAMQADRFLKQPSWSIDAMLNQAPLERALPVARRLGMPLPESFAATGALSGAVEYSSAKGLSGALTIQNLRASIAGEPRFQAGTASVTIASDHFHLDPTSVQQAGGGTLEAGGDYYFSSGRVAASLHAEQFSAGALKKTLAAWFGSPPALDTIEDGRLTGELHYDQSGEDAGAAPAAWSGSFRLAHATLRLPALARALIDCSGRVAFDNASFSLTHFSGRIGGSVFHASYRYIAASKTPERLSLQMPAATLVGIQREIEPALLPGSLLARLRFTRRHLPAWLRERDMQVDVAIGKFSVRGEPLGALRAHLIWRGPDVDFLSLRLRPPEGIVWGHGDANLSADVPRYHFVFGASGIPWKDGLLSAQGELTASGFGSQVLDGVHATGTFAARDVAFSPDDMFRSIQGGFAFSLPDGRPDLEATGITATDDRGAWTGELESRSDGKLIANLQRGGDQRHVFGDFKPSAPASGGNTHPAEARRSIPVYNRQ